VAKQAGTKADRLGKMGNFLGVGTVVAGGGTFFYGLTLAVAAPAGAPILALAGILTFMGGFVSTWVVKEKAEKARNRQEEAIAKRVNHLDTVAKRALEGVIGDSTVRAGLDLRIEFQDETPKTLHVEDVRVAVNGKREKKLTISARFLEEDGRDIDGLSRFWPGAVLYEQTVAAFPKAVLDSIQSETPPSDAGTALAPEPTAVREPEKRLPRITL
jgi:hypothetical protein